MFAPTKTWRKWNVKVNHNEKRYATASAIAATAVASLVLARGHRVEKIPEIPLVVSTDLESIQKTKEAVAALKAVGAHSDLLKVLKSKKLRAGKGKYRNRRWTQRRGPLVVYAEDNGIVKALRNVPGVETANVASLNLLQLAVKMCGLLCFQPCVSACSVITSPDDRAGDLCTATASSV